MNRKIIEKVFESEVIRSLLESVTEEEKKEFELWVEENLSPLDEIVIGISDMLSTEKSSEKLFDAINEGILRPKVRSEDVD